MTSTCPRRNGLGRVDLQEVQDEQELERGTFQVDLAEALAVGNGSEIKWESFRIESVSIEQNRVLFTSFLSRPSWNQLMVLIPMDVVDMLERQLEAMKLQGMNSPQELGEGRSNHHQVHNPTEPGDPIPGQGLFSFTPSTSTGNSPGYPLGGFQPGLVSPAHVSPNQNQLYDQVQSYFPPSEPASSSQTTMEQHNQPQMVYEPVQPFAYVPSVNANAPPPQTTTNMQYPTYPYPIEAVQAQNLTQEPREVFAQPTGLQTAPKPDIWALNSVKPATVGFNWFQAVSNCGFLDYKRRC
jgi:hypothetical protein